MKNYALYSRQKQFPFIVELITKSWIDTMENAISVIGDGV